MHSSTLEKSASSTYRQLLVPFHSTLNKDVELAHQHTLEWVRRFNLITEELAYERCCASKIAWLVARFFPNAPLEELQIACDWTTWIFILDDYSEANGHRGDRLAKIYTRFIDILAGVDVNDQDEPLAHALRDIQQRLLRKITPDWMLRFIHRVEECFESWLWEAKNRAAGAVPDVATYIKMRQFTSGLYTWFELIVPSELIESPQKVWQEPIMQQLTSMANNIISWTNDISSLDKELRDNDVHNLVFALQHDHRLTLEEALERAVELHNAQMQAFIDLEQRLSLFGAGVDANVKRYMLGLRSMIGGHLDWLQETGRYR